MIYTTMLKSITKPLPTFVKQFKRGFADEFVCNPSSPGRFITKSTVTENGVRVITEESTSPLACIALVCEAGSRFETACNNGITHFIEHMAFKGFNSLSKCQFEEYMLYTPCRFNVSTSRELQIFSATCLPESASNVVDMLSKILFDLELDPCEMELEKYRICHELEDADNDPKQIMFDYLHATAFQGTPLAQRVIGPTRNIRRFDRKMIKHFICDHYVPWRLVLASSGNLSHDKMIEYTRHMFGNMQSTCADQDYGPCRFTGSQVMYRDDSMPFAHVAIAFEAPGYKSEDYLPLMVASELLGSWDKSQGTGNRFASHLAQAGSIGLLCESFESFYKVYRDVGLWGIYFVAKSLDIEDFLYNVQNAWMHLCTTTKASDVERGVNATKLKLAKRFNGSISSCYDAGNQMMYYCERKTVLDLFEQLEGMKDATVSSACTKILYDKCPAVAAVGPTEGVPEYTRIRAGQYWMRL